jgi:hypothetical protein
MNVTLQQAVDIHARVQSTRFGLQAVDMTNDMIERLRAFGDRDGAAVQERVKCEIVRLQARGPARPQR